jgi:putative peptide zinc metalloprotease protein
MNLAEVLNEALPELPARRAGRSYPKLHPRLIAREQLKDGAPAVVAMVSGGAEAVLFFTPEQWKLASLFDGEHSFSEISEIYLRETGITYTEEETKTFADQLDAAGVFYKTTLALNNTAAQKLKHDRTRRLRAKLNVAHMTFSSWDPDKYLTWLHGVVGFVYKKWFTLLTLAMFGVMVLIFIGGWSEIWRDTGEYYSFTHKSGRDLAEFWILFCGLGFFHETAHGLTCKHYGGGVHRMGFMLVYLSPCFFVDVTEVYVYGGKWQRIAAIIAGIWVELMFCSAASILWWGTPLGSPIHDFAYKIMLITGVAVVLMNLNPLIKLDGYYLFGELVGVSSLKEDSTEYVSHWVKRNLLGLPVEIPYVRPGRRRLFVGYAVLSGLYSYLVLFAVLRFTYNVFLNFSPQWAFLPALALALLIFRSRLRALVRFMKDLYLDKRQSLQAWWTTPRKAVAFVAGVVVFFAPMWRQAVSGRFLLEPGQRAVLRAEVAGQVAEVLADEGSRVNAGAPVLLLRNARLEDEAGRSRADLRVAQAGTRGAELNSSGLGAARSEESSQASRNRAAEGQLGLLQVASPIAGLVVSPRIRNLAGSYVAAGTELAEVDEVQTLKARIFVPDFEVRKVAPGAPVSLKLEAEFQPLPGRVASVSPSPLSLPAGLIEVEKYKGAAPPPFYVATVTVTNDRGTLRAGMTGDAKIEVRRRSLAWFVWENLREFVQRKMW